MATTMNEPIYPDEERRSVPLASTLSRGLVLNWEKVLIIVILLMAIFTRFYNLGERAMSHDESLHVYYAYELYDEGKFVHTPLMHGPIIFHASAFFYSLFGDNDFTARIYTALLGVFMVMSPLLFRRWLGRWGALLACIMILASPLLMYYNRYIREDTPAIMSSILMVWSILMYLKGPDNQKRRAHWLYILSAATIYNLASKETAFFYVGVFGLFLLVYWFARLAQYFFNKPGRVWFNFLALAVALAGVASLGMYIILDITPLERVREIAAQTGWFADLEPRSFVLWTLLVAFAMGLLIVGTMLYAFRNRFSRLPFRELILLAVMVAVVLVGLIVMEEISHVQKDADTVEINQPVPGEEGEEGVVVPTSAFTRGPIIMIWVLMFIVIVGMWYSRRANWWRHLDQFPELDVMIVLGALILPWLTAILLLATHGSAEDFSSIGASIPQAILNIIPVSGTLQGGQFVVGFLIWLPMMVIAMVTGLTWNWQRFLICWLIFHAIFAFFYTTIFTNIQGLATGMIYSLQYWLEQQGERRGNQPQYYYLLIIMPLYEYLPIIGSVLAAFTGMTIFWRRRNVLDQAIETNHQAILEAVASEKNADDDNAGLLVEGAKRKTGDMTAEEAQRIIPEMRTAREPSFLLFVSWWAIFIIVALTLSGEKMPWLATHMTTPMIFLTAWYFGNIFERVEWRKVTDRGWLYLLLVPFLLILVFQLIAQPLGGRVPFAGTSIEEIKATNTWLAAAFFTAVVVFALYRLGQYTGWRHLRHMFAVSIFAVLVLITFRAAWMASFVNYDLAIEYLVYAHATPGTKIVAEKLEELSLRTTNGMNLKFAYDDKMSWPGVWYFRHYDKNVYMGKNPTLQQMEGSAVVLVGEANRSVVEPLLEDRYQRFEYSRMWWPMMDYFNLTAQRIVDTFYIGTKESQTDSTQPVVDKAAAVRRGLFDIWWNRDYTAYGKALNKDFSLPNWPVQEKMYMYVRKDIAAQVWQYGTGDGSVTSGVEVEPVSACVANWLEPSANMVFNTAGSGLRTPIGMSVAPDGTLYVADAADANSWIVKFNTTTGEFIGAMGTRGAATAEGAFFERPHSVAVAQDGTIYVVDTWNYKIRAFNADGDPVTSWGQSLLVGFDAPAQPLDGFWGPRDIAIDAEGNVYVADTGNKRIRVYTASGQYIRDIGSGGSALGELDEPSGIAISADGRLYIADTWNRRISVFSTDGSFLATYPVRAWYDVQGSRPYIAVDPNRPVVYVTDPEGGRVLVLSQNGDCLGAFGRPNRENPTNSQFHTIGGITVDQDGNIYVSDTGNSRILRFDPFPLADEQLLTSADVEIQPESTAEVVQPESTAEVGVETTAEVVTTDEVETVTEEIEPATTADVTMLTAEVQP